MFDHTLTPSVRSASSIDFHVGRRLRERRHQVGVSQEALAEKLGLTFQQIQKYENGINRIGAGRLFEIAAILKVDLNFFFAGLEAGPAEAGAGQQYSPQTREAGELLRAFERIESVDTRRALVRLAQTMCKVGPGQQSESVNSPVRREDQTALQLNGERECALGAERV